MKRLLLTISAFSISILVTAQTKVCATDQNLQDLKKANPQVEAMLKAFEAQWQQVLLTYNPNDYKTQRQLGKAPAPPKYIIPVVVHVFHNNGAENITDAQVLSEIAFLNKSFRNLNNDSNNRRAIFKDLAADAEIEFRLAKRDPMGRCTDGIVRYHTPLANDGNDDLKRQSVWDSKRYFNIWVVGAINKGPGLGVAGYAQFPAGNGFLSVQTDGIMVIHNEFGSIGTSFPGQTPNVTTSTHEAGHWFGLYHPFQNEDTCGKDNDGVYDTPPTFYNPTNAYPLRSECGTPNYNSCGGTDYRYKVNSGDPFKYADLIRFAENPDYPDMQENYMDYFIGACASNMFTLQQKARMHFTLNTYRRNLWSAENLVSTGVSDSASPCNLIPMPALSTNSRTICAGATVQFANNSYNGTATTYAWEFSGGNPATASVKTPGNITYAAPGTYDVKLSVGNANGTRDTIFKNYITVLPATSDKSNGAYYADWKYQNNWMENGWTFVSENGKGKWEFMPGISPKSDGTGCMKFESDPGNSVPTWRFTQNLISPAFNLSSANTPYIEFDYAAALTTIGSTQSNDALRVYYSTDCGKTWATAPGGAFTGTTISTVGTNRIDYTAAFVPTDASKWKNVRLASSSFKNANIRFKIELYKEGGSTFYLDNVHVGFTSGISESYLAKAINFSVQPNPFTQSTSVSYKLDKAEQVTLIVYDVLGKEVGKIFSGIQNPGEQNLSIDRHQLGLGNGMYFIKLSIGNSSLSQRILVN